ncbi:MAG: T9SS type A sorting domain-containing protein [Paludibacteraceae bacterium]|nr:T9SS type A sorting domain-containing protein [Paludibacteraceae bacterium]
MKKTVKIKLSTKKDVTDGLGKFPDQVTLYNSEGKIMTTFHTSGNQQSLSIVGWPDGVYPVVINQDGLILSNMLIIKH